MKKVHPSVSKRISTTYNVVESSPTPKKLRRLPHVFAKVLELPFHSGADVSVQETSDSFRFSITVPAFSHQVNHDEVVVRANAIEIYPAVTKVVIQKMNGADFSPVVNDVGGYFDKWRFRLPASTRPELANATYVGQELVVTVPKNQAHHVHGDRSTREEQDQQDENDRLIVIQ